MKVQPYLVFNGNCEEALSFYSSLFDASLQNKQTYQDANYDIPESYRNNLQHAELKGNGVHIMAYDASPDTPLNSGNNVQMSIDLDDKDKAEKLFNQLYDGGTVHHKFREREWGAYFGRCTDKYDIQWMINCSK